MVTSLLPWHQTVRSLSMAGPLVSGAREAAIAPGEVLDGGVFLWVSQSVSLGRQGLSLGHRGGTEMMVFLTENRASRKME